MTTMTEKITQELLDAAGQGTPVEDVLKAHASSKGPLYNALAAATAQMSGRLLDQTRREQTLRSSCATLQAQKEAEETECQQLKLQVQSLNASLKEAQQGLDAARGLMDLADSLVRQGFGQQELARLSSALCELAASAGLPPQDGVTLFFTFFDRCRELLALDVETQRAQNAVAKARSEQEKWEAAAGAAEARSKLRRAFIDIAEGLVAKGVKEKDLVHWNNIIIKSGVAPESLSASLTKHSSLEAASRERAAEVQRLTKEAALLKTEVTALQKQRQETIQAITVVRDQALAAVHSLQQEALRYGELQRQAGTLEEELGVARAILHDDVDRWKQMIPRVASTLLVGLTLWARNQPIDPKLAPPEAVASRTWGVRYDQVPASDLLYWAYASLFQAPRAKALQGH